jgi:bifunctional non-homologous end joining protein LigD
MSASDEIRRRLQRREAPYEPCLPRPAKEPPAGADWIHEIKHDGFPILARKDGDRVRLITRNGYDFAGRFPLAVAAIAALPARSCLVDSEVIVCGDGGLSVFELLRYRHYDHLATLCGFDRLELNFQDVRPWPLEQRKAALKMLLRKSHPGIAYNRTFDVEGSIVFHHACKLGCGGIVSKRVGRPYRSGRSPDWIKVKNPKAPAVCAELVFSERAWADLRIATAKGAGKQEPAHSS